ncbi:transposable element Tc3 transposase [Trichonephila clavipes]|nr:transposable element Tc3 transposase [Trichonephila clavipes]
MQIIGNYQTAWIVRHYDESDDFLRGRIIGRLECGRTQLKVSEELGIAQCVISRLWQRFQDDGNVSLQSDSSRTLIWRAPGTRYHQENIIERHQYGGAGWLVWGGIILGSRTDLHVHSATMTDHISRDVILEQHVRLFRGTMGAEFLFMDDNARPPRAKIVDECLQSEDITRMDWPAYSPDLNPIEHVWDMLGRRIAARQPPPTCLPELRRALLDEWCNIPQDQIDNLILSMPRRFKNQRTKQEICKTSLTWNTNETQLNNGGDRWSVPAATHVQRIVRPDFIHRTLLSEVVLGIQACKPAELIR